MFRKVYSLKQKLIEMTLKGNEGERVFVFHQVADNEGEYKNDFGVTATQFKAFISKMLSDGEPFFPINEIGAGKKYLTFDDGYGDVVKNVYPLLKESVTPFCVFITTEFVGKQGYLSWEDVKMLSKEPLCTIGAHAKTHPLLRKCDEVKAEDEIVGSKYALESKINRSVDYFAYPYGSVYACSSRDIILAKAYKKAFSTLNGRINKSSSPWFLPRITIAGRTIDKYT